MASNSSGRNPHGDQQRGLTKQGVCQNAGAHKHLSCVRCMSLENWSNFVGWQAPSRSVTAGSEADVHP